jgi:hypothetical protein
MEATMATPAAPAPIDRAANRPVRSSENGWLVWAAFGGIVLVIAGAVDITAGLLALARPSFFVAAQDGIAVALGWTTWGVIHLAWGAAFVAVGLGVLAGNRFSQGVAVVLAGASVVRNLLFIDVAPVWMAIVIAIDLLVVYALVVHGHELRDGR